MTSTWTRGPSRSVGASSGSEVRRIPRPAAATVSSWRLRRKRARAWRPLHFLRSGRCARWRRRAQAAERLTAWCGSTQGSIFTTPVGTALEPRNVNRTWQLLCERTKGRKVACTTYGTVRRRSVGRRRRYQVHPDDATALADVHHRGRVRPRSSRRFSGRRRTRWTACCETSARLRSACCYIWRYIAAPVTRSS